MDLKKWEKVVCAASLGWDKKTVFLFVFLFFFGGGGVLNFFSIKKRGRVEGWYPLYPRMDPVESEYIRTQVHCRSATVYNVRTFSAESLRL